MKRKLYFMVDNAIDAKKKILKGERGPQNLYGAVQLEKESKAKIIDANLKSILNLKTDSVVVINRTKYIPFLKLFGKKVVLVAINSNHDLSKNKKTLKGFLLNIFYRFSYSMCDLVVCISEIQRKKLEEAGVKNIVVIPLGVEEKIVTSRKLSKEYYLSIGSDKGKNHSYVSNALKEFNVKVTDGKGLSYGDYLDTVAKCKALILNVDVKIEGASDLSGTTTCYEALLLKKPIFINNQPWLEELFKKNYYFYKNEEELKKLLQKKIKFEKFKDTSHLTLKNFTTSLLGNIERL